MYGNFDGSLQNRRRRMASKLQELRADLAAARRLIAAYQQITGVDLSTPPPPPLVHAWSGGHGHQAVTVTMDGIEVMLVVTGVHHDPVSITYQWQAALKTFRTMRGAR